MPDPEAARLLIAIWYTGPWERLEALVLGVRKDGTLRWEVGSGGSVPGRLADWLSRRDVRWRQRYADEGRNPPARWRRR